MKNWNWGKICLNAFFVIVALVNFENVSEISGGLVIASAVIAMAIYNK